VEKDMQNITAFIDGSTYAASVCDHAVWAAERLGMPVSLVHVLGRRNEVSSQPVDLSGSLRLGARTALLEKLSKLDEERATLGRDHGRALLDDGAARMRASADIEVTTRLRNGDLVEAVQDLAPETRMMVVGKRGEGANFATMHLGSNLDRIVRTATRPVLVVSRACKPVKRFLLAYDGGPSAERAVERLVGGSVLRGLECHILTVGNATPPERDKLHAAAEALRGVGYDVTEHLVTGAPEVAIADAVASHDIDMLVLGKSGKSRLRQLFIGSTTLDLMRLCTIPVLIFP
jgi:nucleotide-binding universal stress UspA family protein